MVLYGDVHPRTVIHLVITVPVTIDRRLQQEETRALNQGHARDCMQVSYLHGEAGRRGAFCRYVSYNSTNIQSVNCTCEN